jgi:coatomer subunit gamma
MLLYLTCSCIDRSALLLQKEATEVFFAVTKLYQNTDMNLRRMVYLCLKDICPDAAEVMIVTNSLMKDMNSPQELYRANAIRVLRTIIDPSLLQQIERYFKQCIVDKAPVRHTSYLCRFVFTLHVHVYWWLLLLERASI